MIEKPTHVGSVQVFIYWDGLVDNVKNILKGNYIAQVLLGHNPLLFPYVGQPEPRTRHDPADQPRRL